MQRILFVLDTLMAGGVENQMTALITGLDRSRFAPHVMCLYSARAGRSTHFLPRLEAAEIPVHLLDLALSPGGKAAALRHLITALYRQNIDLLHTSNYHGNILAGYARLLRPWTKLVVSVNLENTPRMRRNQQVSWRIADRVLCISPHLVEEVHRQGKISRHKLAFLPNGLDYDAFAHNPRPGYRETIAPNASGVFVCLSRIVKRKAPDLIVEAFALLQRDHQLPPDVRAFIVGEVEHAEVQARMAALIAEHQLDEVIIQHERTSQPAAYYHAADYTISPAHSGEGLPNVLLESMAAGKPVIVSEAANRAGVITHGQTGWVFRTGDAAHLAQTIRAALATPPDQRQQMQAACRAKAQEFTMQKMVQRHEQVYDALL
ncbi:MAG: glycosyltransferase family 4 protein [Chloroflexota bacterium]